MRLENMTYHDAVTLIVQILFLRQLQVTSTCKTHHQCCHEPDFSRYEIVALMAANGHLE